MAARTALVTGASAGIGRGIASALARAGVETVVVHYGSDAAGAQQTADEVERLGSRALVSQADLNDETATRRLVDTAVTECGRLDYLVNNAATRIGIPFEDVASVRTEDWKSILDVNLLAPFWCAQQAHAALAEARGAIVNIGSIAGIRAEGSSLPYSVAKAALLHLTRGLARAFAPDVRVNAVAPGRIDTPGFEKIYGASAAAKLDDTIGSSTPLQRVGRPEDVAAVVVALLTAEFVTGETIVVDGGRSLMY